MLLYSPLGVIPCNPFRYECFISCTQDDPTTSVVGVWVGKKVPLGGMGKQTSSHLRKQTATVVQQHKALILTSAQCLIL